MEFWQIIARDILILAVLVFLFRRLVYTVLNLALAAASWAVYLVPLGLGWSFFDFLERSRIIEIPQIENQFLLRVVAIIMFYLLAKLLKDILVFSRLRSTAQIPLGWLILGGGFYAGRLGSIYYLRDNSAVLVNSAFELWSTAFIAAFPLILGQWMVITFVLGEASWEKEASKAELSAQEQVKRIWQRLDRMGEREFENYLADFYRRCGLEVKLLRKEVGDSSALDVAMILDNGEERIGVQTRRYHPKQEHIGVEEVKKVYSGSGYYDCDETWLVTTTDRIARDAQQTAAKLGVDIVGRKGLNQQLLEYYGAREKAKQENNRDEPEEVDESSKTDEETTEEKGLEDLPAGEVSQQKPCPSCGAEMAVRKQEDGYFWRCKNYPECETVKPLTEGEGS